MEVAASALLSTALTAAAGFQLRRQRAVVAHVCGVLAALVPLIIIPGSNPLRTVSFAGALAYLYSIHGLDRVLRKHRPAYEAWRRGDAKELPAKTARYRELFESDITIAQHLTGYVDLTVRRPLSSLTREEYRSYLRERAHSLLYAVPWFLITWYLLPSMAPDYMHAACCSPLGQAVQQLPLGHEPLCHSHVPCSQSQHHASALVINTTSSASPVAPLSGPAAAIVDWTDAALQHVPAHMHALIPSVMASGLSVLMLVELAAAIAWFVTTFKVIEAHNTIYHAAMGYTIHELLGNLFGSRSLADFWGNRWNRAVQPILKNAFFLAVYSKDHPTITLPLAVLLTFFMSGVVHAVPMALSAPVKHSLVMQLFFVAHGVAVLLEAPLVHLARSAQQQQEEQQHERQLANGRSKMCSDASELKSAPKDIGSSNGNGKLVSSIPAQWLHGLVYIHGLTFVVVSSVVLFHFTLFGVANVLYAA